MKLLFDQNISFRIVKTITDIFPNFKQVGQVGLNGASDLAIWEYAKLNDFTIVTFDSDFYDLGLLKGVPPKIIWLRIGNTSTTNITRTLIREQQNIYLFLHNEGIEQVHCLELH